MDLTVYQPKCRTVRLSNFQNHHCMLAYVGIFVCYCLFSFFFLRNTNIFGTLMLCYPASVDNQKTLAIHVASVGFNNLDGQSGLFRSAPLQTCCVDAASLQQCRWYWLQNPCWVSHYWCTRVPCKVSILFSNNCNNFVTNFQFLHISFITAVHQKWDTIYYNYYFYRGWYTKK